MKPALFQTPAPVAITSRKMLPIKRLSPLHLRIITLFIQGKSRTEIAHYLNLKPARVGAVLRNPTAKKLLAAATADVHDEIAALQGPALDVVRERLEDPEEPALALRAADTVFRLNRLYDEGSSKMASAEDVVAKMIASRKAFRIQSDGPVNLTITEETMTCEKPSLS